MQQSADSQTEACSSETCK